MSSNSEAGDGPTEETRSRETAKGGDGTDSNADISADAGGQHPLDHDELHYAIKRFCKRSFAHVQKLLDKGHQFCRGDGLNCFIQAAQERQYLTTSQRWEMLRKMLEVDPRGIHVRDKDGQNLLHYFWQDLDNMKQLIDFGLDLHAPTNRGLTLLESLLLPHLNATVQVQKFIFKLWNLLISYDTDEIKRQSTKGTFFKCVALYSNYSQENKNIFFKIIEWNLLSVEEMTEKLQMHPLFFFIKYKVGLQVLPLIWNANPGKNDELFVPYGKDLTILDHDGKTVMEALMSCDSSFTSNSKSNIIQIWKYLISHKEAKYQTCYDGFITNLLAIKKKYSHFPSHQILFDIFKLKFWNVEKITLELKMHPLFFVLETFCNAPLEFSCLMDFLDEMKQEEEKHHSCILNDMSILITKNISDDDDENYGWRDVKKMLAISNNELTFDLVSLFLYKKELQCVPYFRKCLTSLVKRGFIPTTAAGVVSPVEALLYQVLKKSNLLASRQDWAQVLPDILIDTMKILAGYPVVLHQLVLGPKNGVMILDIHYLVCSVLHRASALQNDNTETLLNLILALMQLSPLHPLQNFLAFHSAYCYLGHSGDVVNFDDLETFCKLLRLLLEASGTHKFQGVDQATIDCVKKFCATLEQVAIEDEVNWVEEEEDLHLNQVLEQPHRLLQREEVGLMLQAAVKAESEVSSLQWLCILRIRKTLFSSRTHTTTTLPSLIRYLVEEGHLPQGLLADVLVYKPNDTINF